MSREIEEEVHDEGGEDGDHDKPPGDAGRAHREWNDEITHLHDVLWFVVYLIFMKKY